MSHPRSNHETPWALRRLIEGGLLIGMVVPLIALRDGDPSLADASLMAASGGYAVGAALVIFRALSAYEGPGAQGALWRIIGVFVAGLMPTLSMVLWSQDRPEVLYPAFYWCGSGCAFAQFVALGVAYWFVSVAETRKGLG